ncbi:SDR family oxidoreductase [Ferrimonas lipolytica]|uniref:SDR family oxidoreductase n=1 Tax=Ferrimonas lipolytica TaxID=2724191 RepID=A0A6H1UC73_9GAMM|nr:SDR family oxidoreductase [Ferrimonas lipolytica]QIZ75806.1 SDR family oxidoreductase [Ferrimonas lipolytica]
MSFTIKDKVAFVTGANRGIGKSIVESFLQHGAKKVYLAVRNVESTKELEAKFGDKVVTIAADVADTDSVNRAAAQATDVDVVVNNAGVLGTTTPLADDVFDVLAHEMDINVYGLLRIAQAFADTLVNNQGALVQLNSVASIKNFSHVTSYAASKSASYSITQGLRDELGPKGVQIVSVHPGPIATDMGSSAGFTNGASTNSVSEGIVDALAKGKFLLFPDEMAKQFEGAYQSFADNIILADISE